MSSGNVQTTHLCQQQLKPGHPSTVLAGPVLKSCQPEAPVIKPSLTPSLPLLHPRKAIFFRYQYSKNLKKRAQHQETETNQKYRKHFQAVTDIPVLRGQSFEYRMYISGISAGKYQVFVQQIKNQVCIYSYCTAEGRTVTAAQLHPARPANLLFKRVIHSLLHTRKSLDIYELPLESDRLCHTS